MLTLTAFTCGGMAFSLFDQLIDQLGGPRAQLMAMLSGLVPESLAVGAMLATKEPAGSLLAFPIALQNFPQKI